jgi:hypothetical protein
MKTELIHTTLYLNCCFNTTGSYKNSTHPRETQSVHLQPRVKQVQDQTPQPGNFTQSIRLVNKIKSKIKPIHT